MTLARMDRLWWALRIGLGTTALVAGADKFFDRLTRWEKYLAPEARRRLPVSRQQFMYVVGAVEILVGLGILARPTRLGSYAMAAWLSGIAANLVMNEDYDIAVRDLNMALGAVALGELTAALHKERRRLGSIVQEPHISEWPASREAWRANWPEGHRRSV